MNAWMGLALIALGSALTAVWAWGCGYHAGRAESRRDAARHEATALGWMKVACQAEARADAAELLLDLDKTTWGTP